MKRIYYAGFLMSALLFLTACGTQEPAESQSQGASAGSAAESSVAPVSTASAQEEGAYHKITAGEAKEMMDKGGVIVVDVRTPEEYAQGHIEGAVNIPNESIGAQPPQELADKKAILLVHCRTGVRSKNASEKLVSLGYENIYDFGGIVDWTYGTVSGDE